MSALDAKTALIAMGGVSTFLGSGEQSVMSLFIRENLI